MSVFTISATLSYVTEVCCNCGVNFAMEQNYQNRRLNDKQGFYCPNGHRQHYIEETAAERLQKQLVRERAEHDQTKESLRRERASSIAQKGAITKMKKRASAGVCPCCSRHFTNLERHMKTKHENFGKD